MTASKIWKKIVKGPEVVVIAFVATIVVSLIVVSVYLAATADDACDEFCASVGHGSRYSPRYGCFCVDGNGALYNPKAAGPRSR